MNDVEAIILLAFVDIRSKHLLYKIMKKVRKVVIEKC